MNFFSNPNKISQPDFCVKRKIVSQKAELFVYKLVVLPILVFAAILGFSFYICRTNLTKIKSSKEER